MDVYSIDFSNSARKALLKLPDEILKRIAAAIEELTHDPFGHGAIKLTDADLYRVRVGNYRIIYEVDTKIRIIFISDVVHRSQAYR